MIPREKIMAGFVEELARPIAAHVIYGACDPRKENKMKTHMKIVVTERELFDALIYLGCVISLSPRKHTLIAVEVGTEDGPDSVAFEIRED